MDGGRLFVLGVPRIVVGEREHVLRGTQARLVLARLALAHGQVVTAEQLVDVLWPHGPGAHWEGALRGVLSKLRGLLAPLAGGVRIESIGRSYRLIAVADVTIDIWQARDDVAEIEVALALSAPDDLMASAERATGLLTPELLPGADSDWLDLVRRDLAAQRRRAFRLAAEVAQRVGRFDQSLEFATVAVGQDPFDEHAHRLVMQAHAGAGRRGAALRAYELCRRVLADDLGTEPHADTEALYLEMLGNPSISRYADGRPPPSETSRAFVGRAHELERLAEAWDRANRGSPEFCFLSGETGVGKTRLALEAAARFRPAGLLYGRCSAERLVPYEPFSEAIGSLAAPMLDDELTAFVGRYAQELSALVPSIARRLGLLGTSPTDGDNRPRLFECVRSLFTSVLRHPKLVIIDDLHHADTSTIEMLSYLVRTLDDSKALVIATYRDDLPLGDEAVQAITIALGHDRVRVIKLSGLATADIETMLHGSTHANDPAIAADVRARTNGNALYVCQILRSIDETGEDFDFADIPDNVMEMVRGRLAGLSAPARQTLEIAAVIGTTVPFELLDAAVQSIAGADAGLDELLERHLLVESPTRDLAFAHGLVRDAAYGLLPGTRRRRLHGRVARAIHGLADDRADLAATLASHLDSAQDPARRGELVDALLRASQAALVAGGYALGADFCRRAAVAASGFSPGDERDALIQVRLGAASRRAGDHAAATDALSLAMELARRYEAGAVFAESVLEMVARGGRGAAPKMSDGDRVALLEEGIARLGDADAGLAVDLHAELALALVVLNEPGRMRAAAAAAVEIARADGRPEVGVCAIVAGRLLLAQPSGAPARLADTDRFISDRHALSTEQRVRVHMWRAADRLELGDRPRFEDEVESLSAGAASLGQPYWMWVAGAWRSCQTFLAGDIERAYAEATTALEHLTGIDHPEARLSTALQTAIFRLHQGHGSDLVELLEAAVTMYPNMPSIRCGLAQALALAGQVDRARREYLPLVRDCCAVIPHDGMWSISVTSLAETAALLRDVESARELITALEPFAERFVVVSLFGAGACWGPVSAQLGALYAVTGDLRGARRCFDQALGGLDHFGSPSLTSRVLRVREAMVGRRG